MRLNMDMARIQSMGGQLKSVKGVNAFVVDANEKAFAPLAVSEGVNAEQQKIKYPFTVNH
jgi:hypothetical protein